jgi:peptidoglycan-associated lipoprotein
MRPSMLVVTSLVLAAGFVGGCGGKKEPAEPVEQPVVEAPPPPPSEPVVDAPPPTPPAEPPLVLDKVYFDYDRYDLREDARTTLAANASKLQAKSGANITIEGHCDERGTVEYNLALGEKRAGAAKEYLVNYGIAGDRLSTVSYGEERPADPAGTEEAYAANRRAEFVVR